VLKITNSRKILIDYYVLCFQATAGSKITVKTVAPT